MLQKTCLPLLSTVFLTSGCGNEDELPLINEVGWLTNTGQEKALFTTSVVESKKHRGTELM